MARREINMDAELMSLREGFKINPSDVHQQLDHWDLESWPLEL
jgi:hypothetical protein